MWIKDSVRFCAGPALAAPAALSYQTACKNVTHMVPPPPSFFFLARGTDWAAWKVAGHPRNTNKGNHMQGDELGKLHNIFIRYNFTRLVDGLQGDTLKTNAESWVEKKKCG